MVGSPALDRSDGPVDVGSEGAALLDAALRPKPKNPLCYASDPL
ncbi:hypothetical protein IMCC26207_1062 [Actinobacteria bacterium IMCC26207]|nr:hypothetical protein IMCC26207_1062 [Actinobacteria bacterium IMCC26207]